MRIRISDDTSESEAEAIAEALATHFEDDVILVVDSGEEVGSATYDGETSARAAAEEVFEDDLGPTEREEALLEEIEEILEGGPEKYKEQLPEEGKLFVRDRIDLWFGEEFLFEDGKFAAFDDEDKLPADGLITGAAEFEGRDLHFMANDYTVKRGSMAAKGVEKFLRMQERALKTGRPVLYLMDSSGGRIDQQTGFFANREGIGKYYYN
ncbi:MAG: carboxyl transferase domain-containing protein, partial [Halorientalis sp.]